MIKGMLWMLLVVAGVLVGRTAEAGMDYTYLDFSGHQGLDSSYTFSRDGLSVSAEGASWTGSMMKTAADGVLVGQYSHGLGIRNAHTDNSHTVDGYGWQDILVLSFNQDVWLKKIYFGYSNSGDKARLLAADLTSDLGTYSLSSVGSGYYKVELPGEGLVGRTFGIQAPGRYDSFKVKGVKVHSVPTPAAGLAGMSLLGLLVLKRRRLRA